MVLKGGGDKSEQQRRRRRYLTGKRGRQRLRGPSESCHRMENPTLFKGRRGATEGERGSENMWRKNGPTKKGG